MMSTPVRALLTGQLALASCCGLGELLVGEALDLTAHGELDAGQPEAARRVRAE